MADLLRVIGLKLYPCPSCGTPIFGLMRACPYCKLRPKVAATATQLVRVYTSGNREAALKRDIEKLSPFGWIAGDPSYGGARGAGLVTRGGAPTVMTVLFTRPRPAPSAS